MDVEDSIRKKNNLFFRQLIFLGILFLMGAVMLKQLAFFIGSFLGAITFYIVFRGLLFRMVDKRRWKPWLAAVVIVVGICAALLGFGYGIFEMLAKEMNALDTTQLVSSIQSLVPKVNKFVGFNLLSQDAISQSSSFITKIVGSAINTTYSFAANILMTILILYFMLAHARSIEMRLGKYLPFRGESRKALKHEITTIIYSNAVGIPLMMLSQGLVAALVYWLFEMSNIVFWAFMTALAGLIPMVGTMIISIPLGVYYITQGFVLKGILLALCGLLVIANVDNLTRIVLNQKITNTHPLIVIFGVILGIPLFGFWGIIFGPLMISVFLLLIRIYYQEYGLLDPELKDLKEPKKTVGKVEEKIAKMVKSKKERA